MRTSANSEVATINHIGSGYPFYIDGGVDHNYINCDLGSVGGGTTLMSFVNNPYCQLLLVDCKIGAAMSVPSLVGCLPGSSVKIHNYNQVSNRHNMAQVYGQISSCGDGLTDTTVHTAGTGKFALRLTHVQRQ